MDYSTPISVNDYNHKNETEGEKHVNDLKIEICKKTLRKETLLSCCCFVCVFCVFLCSFFFFFFRRGWVGLQDLHAILLQTSYI